MIELEIDDNSSGSSDSMTKVSRLNLYSTSPIKKKRKSYKRLSINPTFMPALRIFKNDIRRRYIDMITNVINSYDTKLHEKFFLDFALPGATHTYHRFPPEFLALLQHPPHLVGLEQVLHTYEMHYLMIPDIVFRYSNIKLCKRLGSPGSRIIATVRASGKMQFVVPMDKSSENKADDSTSALPAKRSMSEPESTSSNIILSSNHNLKPVFLERLPEPVDFDVVAMLTINLDDEHRFISVELLAM